MEYDIIYEYPSHAFAFSFFFQPLLLHLWQWTPMPFSSQMLRIQTLVPLAFYFFPDQVNLQ